MKFYNRNGMLYVSIGDRRVSTKLEYSKSNIKFYESYAKNEEFFEKFSVRKKDKSILDFCEEVLLEKEQRLQPTSMTSYYGQLRKNILPFFNKKYPQEITPLILKNWYLTFKDKATLNTCVSGILKPAFENAIIEEHIKITPFIIRFPTFKSNYEMNPFNLQEIQLILDNATGWFKNFLGIAFFTGMRTGEVLGLEWKDINFKDSIISITKTKSSVRDIDMLSQVEMFLKNQQKLTSLNKKVFLKKQDKDFYSSVDFKNIWKELLNKCHLEYRNVYQTRHSFTSNIISNGEDVFWASQMLGHKNMNITLDKYSKYIKSKKSKKKTFLDEHNNDYL